MKWIILIIMIVVSNGIGYLGWVPTDWQNSYRIVANVLMVGWTAFTLMSQEKKQN